MKIKDLKGIAYSSYGSMQMAVLYDYSTQKDVALGTVDYIIKEFGDLELIRLQAQEHRLVLGVKM